jgi:hypothetical protein
MTAWIFEVRHCPALLNEIKKTKLTSYNEPQAGINILLVAVAFWSQLFNVVKNTSASRLIFSL